MAMLVRLVVLFPFLSLAFILQTSYMAAAPASNSTLSTGYYASSCPQAEKIVRQSMRTLTTQDPTAGAALLRLVFHDCDVTGCDASILLDSTSEFRSEIESPKNFGIRRLDFISRIKQNLEAACPRTVSCADVIALAARDSILLAGGPDIPVPLGRKDSTRADFELANRKLATVTSSVDTVLSDFASIGIDTEETVALLGAHTLGVGHCLNVMNRLYPQLDKSLDRLYSMALRVLCPSPRFYLNMTAIPNDSTMFRFDNMFFKNGASRRVPFTLDAAMQADPRTKAFAAKFAQDQAHFFNTFSTGFIKLTSVLPKEPGQIRTRCNSVNS